VILRAIRMLKKYLPYWEESVKLCDCKIMFIDYDNNNKMKTKKKYSGFK
jgi:hypothetical protein